MADDCGCGPDENLVSTSAGYRRALWIVVGLNIGYGVIELIGGFLSNSQALKADALDFLGDGSITFLAIMALGWSLIWRARSAFLQGLFLGGLGLWVLMSTVLRLAGDSSVEASLMGAFAFAALIVNLLAVVPLMPYREGDANMRAVWLFSRNDAIGNVAVIIAAVVVWATKSSWPDLIVAIAIAGLFLHSAWGIIRDARRDLNTVKGEI